MRSQFIAVLILGGSIFAQTYSPTTDNTGKLAMAQLPTGIGAQVPSGMIMLTLSSACPTGFTEVSALNGKFVLGTVAANSNVGTTGGSATIIPAGTNSATSATPAGTIAWPASVPTNATASFTPAGTNTGNTSGATSAGTPAGTVSATGTAALTTAASAGQNTANNTHTHAFVGSAMGTHTHSVAGQVFVGSAGTVPAQVISWPASVPLFAGASLTIPAQTFVGTPVNPAPPYVVVLFCSKN